MEMTVREVIEALRQMNTRADGKLLMSDAEIDAQAQAIMQVRERFKPVCDEHGKPLPPEEQIKRKPDLALDTPESPPELLTMEQIQTELLRWFKQPEQARGRWHFVPRGHPSGFGGHEIYIPRQRMHG